MTTLNVQHIPYLLGKWRRDSDDPLVKVKVRGFKLSGHMAECMLSWRGLFDEHHFGRRLFQVMDLSRFTTFEHFRKLCGLATLTHDLGKCSQEFQTMLWLKEWEYQKAEFVAQFGEPLDPYIPDNPRKIFKQQFRHEFMTRWILTIPEVWAWLVDQAGSESHAWMVVSAAFGHHRKTEKALDVSLNRKPHLFLQNMSRSVQRLSTRYQMGSFPVLEDRVFMGHEAWEDMRLDQYDQEEYSETPLSLAVKWCTILADVTGSVENIPLYNREQGRSQNQAVQVVKDLKAKLPESFQIKDLLEHVRFVTEQQFKEPRPFQRECLETPGDVLLKAPCGGGKTVAAYLWANQDRSKRVIFTGPTTGTASQLYKDYRGDALRHGRQFVDQMLEGFTVTPYEEQNLADTLDDLHVDVGDVMFCTVDQLLGLMTFQHKAILWLLAIVDSQIVFDEYHSYDRKMRVFLKRFLQVFPGLRVMGMTATSSASWTKAWVDARPGIAQVPKQGIADPSALIPRYRVHRVNDAEEYFQEGTLWMVNTVAVAQEVTEDSDALCYHARFRYEDKVKRQQDLIAGFRGAEKPRAVATQIAQMSLDISATSMISELCPANDLLQRLGRVNRGASPQGVANIYVYKPETLYPYWSEGDDEPSKLWAWLGTLEGRNLSQQDFEQELERIESTFQIVEGDTLMMSTNPESLREDMEYMATVLLSRDYEDLVAKYGKEKVPAWALQRVEISTPMNKETRESAFVFKHRYVVNWKYRSRTGLHKPTRKFGKV